VVADPKDGTFGVVVRAMFNDQWGPPLNDVDGDIVSSCQRHDLWFSSPDTRTSHGCAVIVELLFGHEPVVEPGFIDWQEWQKVARVRMNEVCRCRPDVGKMSLVRRQNSEQRKLVCDGGEQTMAVCIHLVAVRKSDQSAGSEPRVAATSFACMYSL